jgi:hypothetical protein
MSHVAAFGVLCEPAEIVAKSQPAISPVISGLYFLLMNRQIVYVGQSMNCHNRIHTHMASDKEFDAFTIFPMEIGAEFNTLEALYILKYQPRYNMTLPPCPLLITAAWFRNNRVNRTPLRRLIADGQLEVLQFRGLTFYWRHEIERCLEKGAL